MRTLDPLITIETVPIKIEYTEKATSHSTSQQSAKLNISHQDNTVKIQSDPISISMTDAFEFSSSSDKSHLTYTATAQYSGAGNLSMNVQMQSASDATYQYQQFGRGIDSIVDSIPSSKNNTTDQKQAVNPEQMRIDFDMSQVFKNNTSSSDQVDTSFYPPDLELKVVERPKVIVKYVGEPIYFPKSANPEYEPADQSVAYFPESADPNYDEKVEQLFDTKIKLDLRA